MKRLLAVIGLGIALALPWMVAQAQSPLGPPNQILCNAQAQFTSAAAGTSSLVAGITGQRIDICGWHVTSAQTTNNSFQLEYGTQGGPCTTPTTLTPALNITSTAPSADHVDYAQMEAPLGAQVCVVTAGSTVALTGMIWYNQHP